MCIGTVMQAIEAGEFSALCVADGMTRRVDLSLVGPQPAGVWLLVFLDAAREVLDVAEAGRIRAAHAALREAMLTGDADVARYFPDLTAKESPVPLSAESSTVKPA